MASSLCLAVLAVTHLSKNTSSALYRASGSVAFVAAARAVWFFGKNPDDPEQRLMVPGKMNLAPDQEGLSYTLRQESTGAVTVAWGQAVRLSADAVLQPEAVEQKSERLEAMEWLRERLSAGAISAKQIRADAKASGFSWSTLRRAKDALLVRHSKQGFEGGWLWELALPEDAHEIAKMPTSKTWAPSSEVDTFGADGPAKMEGITTGNGQANPREYIPDCEGPGCTCCSCSGHFGTVAGWRAHISRGRCMSHLNVSGVEGIQ